jgi:hypothetical protein
MDDEQEKASAEENYRKIVSIHCPYLKQQVNFNSKGLDHIKMKEWNKARPLSDQIVRLKLLHLAPEVIKSSNTLQEYKEEKRFERRRKNSRRENVLSDVRYYAFIAILKNCKIKVIVKQVMPGEFFFWSIVPMWGSCHEGDTGETKKVFHKGDLEKD